MNQEEFAQRLKDQPFSVLSDLVFEYIQDAIVEAKYAPGSKINTKRISEELGVSRTPVRTALEQLEKEKLVESVGEKGFKAAAVDWKDCLSLYEIREMVEGNAAYIAANTITDQQLEQLKQVLIRHRKANEAGDYRVTFESDIRFHELIVLSTGNAYLIDMFRALKVWIRRYHYALVSAQKFDMSNDLRILEKQTVIYRAIKNRYSLVAKNEMVDHLHKIYRILFEDELVSYPTFANGV